MLINCDVKGLEVVTAAELSDDKVLKQEVIDGIDIHERNRDTFKLGSGKPGRLIAKVFKFRMIYGGTAYSYSVDPDFSSVGYSQKQWQRVIDEYYDKYQGLKKWHDRLINTVKEQGFLEIPSGRYFQYEPVYKNGEWKWPLTTIKNYPVQGFGADLVKLARIEFFRRFRESEYFKHGYFICTVHDSLVVDIDFPEEKCYNISMMLKDSVEAVPKLCKEYFDYDFSLPLTAEVQIGPNKLEMVEVKL